MKELLIYEAGKMSGLSYTDMSEWRIELKDKLLTSAYLKNVNAKVVNPVTYYNFEYPSHKSEKEIMLFDLNYVRKSDIVVVNISGLNSSIGTCIELYEAYSKNIPVLAFGSIEEYQILHPWVKECITRVDWNMSELVEYITDFYLT